MNARNRMAILTPPYLMFMPRSDVWCLCQYYP